MGMGVMDGEMPKPKGKDRYGHGHGGAHSHGVKKPKVRTPTMDAVMAAKKNKDLETGNGGVTASTPPPNEKPHSSSHSPSHTPDPTQHLPKPVRHHRKSLLELERQYTDPTSVTNVQEVWFAGCHCDVGGGNVVNGTRHAIARIPLRWMLRQCFEVGTGILFHTELFHKVRSIRGPPRLMFCADGCVG